MDARQGITDPRFQRIADTLAQQGMLVGMGVVLDSVADGEVVLSLVPHAGVSQQKGWVHAAAVSAIADSAAGFATLTRLAPELTVVTAEYKIHLLSPAVGDRLVATGTVLRVGRTLCVAKADVMAERAGTRKLVAHLTATMVGVPL